ncbi:MAG TPA: heat-inducible transcriptional repressor HrcA [Alphaproteobacteria bacterium]
MSTTPKSAMFSELNERSRLIFSQIVESYFDTGEPVGSRTLSRKLPMQLSPATIRNVMADLEDLGLLFAPHTSAGRLPTERGLRLFIDGLLEIGDLSAEERDNIESQCAGAGRTLSEVLNQATEMLSGLTSAAGLVLAPKSEAPVRHLEFVGMSPGRALAIMVLANGLVENRLIDLPVGITASALVEAANYINSRLIGRTLGEARGMIEVELAARRAELDALATRVVEAGLATLANVSDEPTLIVRGRANLFEDVSALADLERIRSLFDQLEQRKNLLRLIDSTLGGPGVHVFIGSESKLFDLAGCSMIVAPLGAKRGLGDGSAAGACVGAIGVIGPTRINYARIIPMVDYTARAIGRLMS